MSREAADWKKYKDKRNMIKNLLFQAREEYVKSKLEEDRADHKKFWRSINKLTGFGKNKMYTGLSEIITPDGAKLRGHDAAIYMNNMYTNAGPNLAKYFTDQWNISDLTIKTNSTFTFEPITEEIVFKLVSDIKISKSTKKLPVF